MGEAASWESNEVVRLFAPPAAIGDGAGAWPTQRPKQKLTVQHNVNVIETC